MYYIVIFFILFNSLAAIDGEMLCELVNLAYNHKDTFYDLIRKPTELVSTLKLSIAIQKLAN